MSGHNKWSKVKHKKAATDAQKSRLFGKISRVLTLESKKVGGDVTLPGLATAILQAKAANMPADNIERAVKKGTGTEAGSMESITYEAYSPGGVALIIDVLTENRNRSAQEIKHLLSKHGSSLAAPGSALWAFEKGAEGWEPKTTVELTDVEGEKLGVLIDELDNNEDIQTVSTNASGSVET
jgi:YebC/PmpR family DNA-binding regulatory protein